MKNTAKIGFLMILVVITLTACATGSINTPLPQTINIEQSGPNEPKEAVDFIGVWEGIWSSESQGYYYSNVLSTTIVIERIKDSRVKAIYSWGSWDTYIKEGWRRMFGEIKNKTIILKSDMGVITLDMGSNPLVVSATMRGGGFTATATLHKNPQKNQQLGIKRDLSHLPEKIKAYNGTWKGYYNNGTPTTMDIEVISEKKVIVTHTWGDNPSKNLKNGVWPLMEAEIAKDGSITIDRGNRILSIKLDKDGTLYIGLNPPDGSWYIDGNLKKVE